MIFIYIHTLKSAKQSIQSIRKRYLSATQTNIQVRETFSKNIIIIIITEELKCVV